MPTTRSIMPAPNAPHLSPWPTATASVGIFTGYYGQRGLLTPEEETALGVRIRAGVRAAVLLRR